nr:tRNA lysidine(34) synthetase TilS [Lachnospiraceae bacterium]
YDMMDEKGLNLWHLRQMKEQSRSEVIMAWLRLEGAAHNITRAHVEMINELIFMAVGREYHLPHGFVVRNGYDHLTIYQKQREVQEKKEEADIMIPSLKPGEDYSVSLPGIDMKFRLRKSRENELLPRKTYAKVFDYDKIEGSMELRHRKEGDYFVIHPEGGKKLLQDYFVEEKIPREERDSIWLLCQDSKVIWILGMRNSEDCRIDNNTKYVLEVEFWRN